MTLTKRDKNLLFGLGIVLVVVIFGNFILLPQWSKKDEIATQLSDKQKEKDKMEEVINKIPENQSELAQLNQTFSGQTRDFFDMEESHAMERRITKIILKQGLSSRDFTINDTPQLAVLSPYVNSAMAKSMKKDSGSTSTESTDSTATEQATTAATTATSTDGTTTAQSSESSLTQSVVYSYNITVTAQGSQDKMKKLISDIYSNYPAIQITSYNMSTQTAVTQTNQVTSAGDLLLTMTVYMCKK